MHSHGPSTQTRGASLFALAALSGLFILGVSGSARAFTYTSGDLVGIFVDGTTELTVDLGPISSLVPGASFTFETPTGFGSDGATGAKFVAYETHTPFSGSLSRNLTFTTEAGVDPTSFNNNITGYVNRIGLAQAALDDGAVPADKFFEVLNSFPAAGSGGVITNTANTLALQTSNPGSYTSTIGINGSSDRVGNNLPFETDNLVTSLIVIELWRGVKTSNTAATSTLFGYLQVEGSIAGAGAPSTRITFLGPAPVPEPGTILLIGLTMLGLAFVRRVPHSG